MVAMTLLSLVLPSSDAFVATIELLSELIATAAVEKAHPSESSFLRQLLCPQGDSNDDQSLPVPRGVLVLHFLITIQCALPVHELRSRSAFPNSSKPVHRGFSEEEDIRDYRIMEAR
jgi:hypothetical protein